MNDLMKKTAVRIMIVLVTLTVTATATSYAQFFRDGENDNTPTDVIEMYGNDGTTFDSPEGDYDNGGFFRSNASNPGNRPGASDGIGQTAPLRDGLPILIACFATLVIVKIIKNKRKKN